MTNRRNHMAMDVDGEFSKEGMKKMKKTHLFLRRWLTNRTSPTWRFAG